MCLFRKFSILRYVRLKFAEREIPFEGTKKQIALLSDRFESPGTKGDMLMTSNHDSK